MTRFFMAALAGALLLGSHPAAADAVADFYKGKQIRFIVRTTVGGDYDQYSRLIARFIGKHIPAIRRSSWSTCRAAAASPRRTTWRRSRPATAPWSAS